MSVSNYLSVKRFEHRVPQDISPADIFMADMMPLDPSLTDISQTNFSYVDRHKKFMPDSLNASLDFLAIKR